jgi:hypothetical protein
MPNKKKKAPSRPQVRHAKPARQEGKAGAALTQTPSCFSSPLPPSPMRAGAGPEGWPEPGSVEFAAHRLGALAVCWLDAREDSAQRQDRFFASFARLLCGRDVDWRKKDWGWALLPFDPSWPLSAPETALPALRAARELAAQWLSEPLREDVLRAKENAALDLALPLLLPLPETTAGEPGSPVTPETPAMASRLADVAARALSTTADARGALSFARAWAVAAAKSGAAPTSNWARLSWEWARPSANDSVRAGAPAEAAEQAVPEERAPRPPEARPAALREALARLAAALPFFGPADPLALAAAKADLARSHPTCWAADLDERARRAQLAWPALREAASNDLPRQARLELEGPWLALTLAASGSAVFLDEPMPLAASEKRRFLLPAQGDLVQASLSALRGAASAKALDRDLAAKGVALERAAARFLSWADNAQSRHPDAESHALLARGEDALRERVRLALGESASAADLRKTLDKEISLSTQTLDQTLRLAAANGRVATLDALAAYPKARQMSRSIKAWLGEPNSGKTHDALEALSQAKTGAYFGPLRLLALEVYDRLRARGVPCSLVTGQERLIDPNARVLCATVEMADPRVEWEVAVIDEIQMIADPDRGAAFSRALVGVAAKTLWVCGGEEAWPAVEAFARKAGESLERQRTKRKIPLKIHEKPFSIADATAGDAFVSFSKKATMATGARLARAGHDSAVIYGALTPEARREQARRFREGEAQTLASTDAIGMGLNLPIRRVIFVETEKFDGQRRRPLNASEIRQIAGRAGRFGFGEKEGWCGAMTHEGVAQIKKAFEQAVKPLPARLPIGLELNEAQGLAEALRTTEVSAVLSFFSTAALQDPFFRPALSDSHFALARLLDQEFAQLPFAERWAWARAPISPDLPEDVNLFRSALRAVSAGKSLDVFAFLDEADAARKLPLWQAETQARLAAFFCWMSLARPDLKLTGAASLGEIEAALESAIARGLSEREGFESALQAAHWLPFAQGGRGHGRGFDRSRRWGWDGASDEDDESELDEEFA